MQWFLKCLTQYADFTGRARRKEYWMFMLFSFLIYILVAMVLLALGVTESAINIVISLLALSLILPNLAVTVRRLHDIDRSGWWVLLMFVPILSLVILVFMFLNGTSGGNRFGPDPKADSGDIFIS